jgi:FkbM family methyltransferase
MYTIPLARRVEATGKVFAFEPVPFTAATLHTVCRLLRTSNVDLRAKACGEEHGVMTFSVPVQSSGALSAGQAHAASRVDTRPGHEEHVRWDRSREVTCEVVPLDEELSQVDEIALIKADIEGMELFAFRGAQRIIERDVPTVISEINPWFLDGFGISVDDLLAFFSSRGYDLYRWNEPSRRLRTVTAPEEVVEDNYVFVHPRRADRLADLTA